ncbi:MAG: phosphoglycerate dehydrogenase [Pseudomonadota bacterium]
MKKILVSDNLSEVGIQILKDTPNIHVDVCTNLSKEELKEKIKDYHGLAIRSATKVTADVIDAAKKLMVIGRAGIGLDNVDIEAATKRGIVVMNAPEGNMITTAEHAIAMMLSLSRNIPQATASMKANKWEKKKFRGKELFDKTLGIIGLGRIGSIVADRAKGLKMNIVAYDPFISEEKAREMEIELLSLDELFERSNYITVHVPLSEGTRNIINKKAFKKMKDGVMIINCARGGIVNEKDLYEAIKSGKVAGAALDVFEKEPPEDNPLFSLDEVICTPHLGASTDEAQENVAIAIAEQISSCLLHGTIRNAVNVPSVTGDTLTRIKPYIDLGEKLGSFQSHLEKGALEEITIEYSGDIAELDVTPITSSILIGIFKPILKDSVNFVNAPVIAKERGVKVVESKTTKSGDFTSLLTIKIRSAKEENIVAGTLFGKKEPRIIRINKFRLEAIPQGNLLLFHTVDRPGVIGNIGSVLGETDINIANMQFSREEIGGKAIVLLNIDTPVSKKIMDKLTKLPNILSIDQLKL